MQDNSDIKQSNGITISYIKALGKIKSDNNLDTLIRLFNDPLLKLDLRREIISSIGRQANNDRILSFDSEQAFNAQNPMELIYQIFRTCLYKSKTDIRFFELGEKIKITYDNEIINKMSAFYAYRHSKKKRVHKTNLMHPTLLVGDAEKTLKNIPEQSVHMAFTSPPYYNAREYSDYHSYKDYLHKMKAVFSTVSRVLEDGRFFIINISPVITKRPGREFESIRYPINYDYHKILEESGFVFIDEIIWIKPEPSVPNRIGGYLQTRKPLTYKPNCITESIMVYRKKCNFLLDKNVDDYPIYNRYEDEEIDTSNCWYIAPRADKDHPAVFPDELCRRVLKYYSFESDVILDPFAGSGTLGRVAKKMNRIPIMCEQNKHYADLINLEEKGYYDVRG